MRPLSRYQHGNAPSKARWQSGYAADCNSVYAGSIPTRASNFPGTTIQYVAHCRDGY